jgi:hypothetical protein
MRTLDRIFQTLNQMLCLFVPELEVCSPDEKITENNGCPLNWAMNGDGQCYPAYMKCPNGYWRADEDENGACVPMERISQQPMQEIQQGFDVEEEEQDLDVETKEEAEEDEERQEERSNEEEEDIPEEEAMGHDVTEKVEEEEAAADDEG